MSDFDPWRSTEAVLGAFAGTCASAGEIAARQAQRLRLLLGHARRHTALHARRLRDLGDDAPLAALPVLRKAELMARFEDGVADPALTLAAVREFVADPARIGTPLLGRYLVWQTSGTSGEPGLFVHDAGALAVYDALELARRPPPGAWRLGRQAFVGVIDGHFASHASVQRLRRLNPWLALTLKSFSLLQPLSELVAALNAWQPAVLGTYPTAAAMLAGEAEAGRLRLALRELDTGGETLSPAVRRRVAAAFGCPVHDSYGASEFLAIAFECGHGRLHVNADWVILEPVDRHGRAVPPGTLSHTTLLTNLANHVQPLIRYDLGDRLRIDPAPCPCGSALPAIQVLGRHDDALVVAGRDGGRAVTLLPLALTAVMEEELGVFDFQIVQRDARTLSLRLGAAIDDRALRRRCHAALRTYAEVQGAVSLRLVDDPTPPGPRGASGKVQRFVARPSSAR